MQFLRFSLSFLPSLQILVLWYLFIIGICNHLSQISLSFVHDMITPSLEMLKEPLKVYERP